MLRHLPPAATPLTMAQWKKGWTPSRSDELSFAEQLAQYLQAPACFTAASGRAALYTLLQSLRQNRDRPERNAILLPAYTCPAVLQVVVDADLEPILVDIVPETMDFQPDQLLNSLSQNVLALIYVHPFGLPQPVYQFLDESRGAGIVVIEDAAQSLGSWLRGQPAGTWGDYGLFSLGPGKAMSVGGGGVVCANYDYQVTALEETWRSLPSPSGSANLTAQLRLAILTQAFRPTGWWLANRMGARRYGNSETGRGYRLRGLSSAQERVAAELLPQLAWINGTRQQNAQTLLQAIRSSSLVKPVHITIGSEPTYLRLPLLAQNNDIRDRLVAKLNAVGIGAGKMYEQALSGLFPEMQLPIKPGADDLAARLLTLPTHHYLASSDIALVARIICDENYPT